MQNMVFSTLEHSKEDSVVINIDTAYLKWKNSFPSVAICFRKGELGDIKKKTVIVYEISSQVELMKN